MNPNSETLSHLDGVSEHLSIDGVSVHISSPPYPGFSMAALSGTIKRWKDAGVNVENVHVSAPCQGFSPRRAISSSANKDTKEKAVAAFLGAMKSWKEAGVHVDQVHVSAPCQGFSSGAISEAMDTNKAVKLHVSSSCQGFGSFLMKKEEENTEKEEEEEEDLEKGLTKTVRVTDKATVDPPKFSTVERSPYWANILALFLVTIIVVSGILAFFYFYYYGGASTSAVNGGNEHGVMTVVQGATKAMMRHGGYPEEGGADMMVDLLEDEGFAAMNVE